VIELEERLRVELARSAEAARPAPDPLGRLLARRRGQRQRRAGALVVALLLALAGGALITDGPRPDLGPTDPGPGPGHEAITGEITSPWTRQLLAAPTRGNLAGDSALVADLTRQLARYRRYWQVDPALDQVKVLLLADLAGVRVYTMAYYNDTRAAYVSSSGPTGTSTADLAFGKFGGSERALDPFVVSGESVAPNGKPAYAYVTALAPPGCQIATSNEARFNADGTVTRTWVDQGGDYLVRPGKDTYGWWRVTCAGVVRDVQLGSSGGPTPATYTGPSVTERGFADPALVTGAMAQWRSLPGLSVNRYRALWGGTPSGSTKPMVVVTGEAPGGGVQVCAFTGTGDYLALSAAVAHGPLDLSGTTPLGPAGKGPSAVLSTALAATADLVAVRLPDLANPYLLSDRLLVIAPAGATELRVSGRGPQTVPLADGVAVLTAKVPASLGLRAVDGTGATLAQSTVAEPDADGLMFGQPLLKRW
jgi:hypothetical protein